MSPKQDSGRRLCLYRKHALLVGPPSSHCVGAENPTRNVSFILEMQVTHRDARRVKDGRRQSRGKNPGHIAAGSILRLMRGFLPNEKGPLVSGP